jgi:hypothetical protein
VIRKNITFTARPPPPGRPTGLAVRSVNLNVSHQTAKGGAGACETSRCNYPGMLRATQLGPIRHCSFQNEGKSNGNEKNGPTHFWRSVACFRALGKRLFWNEPGEREEKNGAHRIRLISLVEASHVATCASLPERHEGLLVTLSFLVIWPIIDCHLERLDRCCNGLGAGNTCSRALFESTAKNTGSSFSSNTPVTVYAFLAADQ